MLMLRGEEQRILTYQRIKKFLIYFLFCLFSGTVFYVFEFIEPYSNEYIRAKDAAVKANKNNVIQLSKVKDYSKGSEVYNSYIRANNLKKLAVDEFNKVKDKEKVFGFKSLKIFAKEFGMFFGFLCYALFNLIRTFYLEPHNNGAKMYHGFIISVCVFYFFWIFQRFQDFSKVTYYVMTFISAGLVVFAVFLYTKYRKDRINKLETQKMQLKKQKQEIATFTYLHTPEEDKEEMLEVLDKNLNNE